MSDFIYSKNTIEKGKLTEAIQQIYFEDKPSVTEFHGDWGSLAVSSNLYNGFQPYETKENIFVVIGGPVLCFKDNYFLKKESGDIGTKAIYDRWFEGKINWHSDLSGPFVIFTINKKTQEINLVTDMMSFIPVFMYKDLTNTIISTHVDVLAKVSEQLEEIDLVSFADFVLHGVITFPFTLYKNIYQINPASIYCIDQHSNSIQNIYYWEPKEEYKYKTINEAAIELRKSLKSYVNSITENVNSIAQFISGVEDPRTLSALLQDKPRDAFIFLDNMNREGVVAKKAATTYGARFHVKTRTKMHYVDILPASSRLVGSGAQYFHAHTYKFHKSCKLNEYSAVFGGLFADALLKGARVKKRRGASRFEFIPDIKRKNYSAGNLKNNLFTEAILKELTNRRQSHLNYVRKFRVSSADEWFELWPSSMNMNIANIHVNRRLFRSYEPFMSNAIVKLSATVPQNWKLNRRLFHRAVKPLLKQTKWLLHGEGHLPYYPWYVNSFIQFGIWSFRQIGRKIGIIKGYQGPWFE